MRSGSGGKDRHHPAIPRLVDALEQRSLDRREFLRTATLLGMAAPVAYGVAGKILGEPLVKSAYAQTPKKGGILRVGIRVPAVDNPHTFSWVYNSNIVRQANDYLSRTQPDGVTVPYLLERLDTERRPQDLDAEPAEGREVVQRRGHGRRPHHLEHRPLA